MNIYGIVALCVVGGLCVFYFSKSKSYKECLEREREDLRKAYEAEDNLRMRLSLETAGRF